MTPLARRWPAWGSRKPSGRPPGYCGAGSKTTVFRRRCIPTGRMSMCASPPARKYSMELRPPPTLARWVSAWASRSLPPVLRRPKGEWRGIMGPIRIDWSRSCGARKSRLIQPSPQVAMDKELLPQERHQIGERPVEGGFQLQETQHQHGDQGRPHLGFDRIGAGAHKGLDLA